MNPALNAHTLSRAINQHGRDAVLLRAKADHYGTVAEPEKVANLRGLYHADHSYLVIETQEAGKVPQRVKPMFMIPYTDAVRLEDLIELDGHTYKVTGVDDPGGLHLCTDLSLEEV